MDHNDKKVFEKVSEVVNVTIQSLSSLFEEFGMHGMRQLTNPSLADLRKALHELSCNVSRFEVHLENQDDGRSTDTMYARMLMQNIKQGVLFAENLLISVERRDIENCRKANDDIKQNSIIPPNWEESDEDK